MSVFGKILTFLVFIGVLVWAFFTVNVYVTRSNWKARGDNWKKAFEESEKARQAEHREYEANREAFTRLYAAEQTKTAGLSKALDDLQKVSRKTDEEYRKIEKDYQDADVQAKILIASQAATLNELTENRKRITKLEEVRVDLILARESAERARLAAENEAKRLDRLVADNAKKIEDLNLLVAELRQTGGAGGGAGAVQASIERRPAPLPENIRGTVVRDIEGDFVLISIGIDAGLEPGSRLDVYREGGGGKYLGTLVVTKLVYPKEAVAEFKPMRGVPISQLRPDELPRKGDTVGQVSVSRTPR